MNIIELAKEAGFDLSVDEYNGNSEVDCEGVYYTEVLERFAALVRAEVMKQVIDTCEAEYKMYDKMVEEDDAGHEEATAMIHLMRKLEKLK